MSRAAEALPPSPLPEDFDQRVVDLDIALLASFLGESSQTRAVRRYREALRAESGRPS